ncbi:MAG: hypothetical protein ACTHZ9_02440 [Leucobacter sp.]
MSEWRNPVGPKDPKVYLRRRLLVLAGLLAIIVVVVLIIVKPGSSGGARSAEDVSLPSDIVTTDPAEDASEDEEELPPCDAEALEVVPVADQASYATGEQPQLSLSVENTDEEACSADLGTAAMEFEISSGDDGVWRSVDCQESPEHLAVILEPGEPLESEAVTWDRTRSSPETCDITRDPVAAGGASYHLRVVAGGAESSDTAQFLLY